MNVRNVGPFRLFSWSIAGNETVVSVKIDNMWFAFDMGFAPTPVVGANHVFVRYVHLFVLLLLVVSTHFFLLSG